MLAHIGEQALVSTSTFSSLTSRWTMLMAWRCLPMVGEYSKGWGDQEGP